MPQNNLSDPFCACFRLPESRARGSSMPHKAGRLSPRGVKHIKSLPTALPRVRTFDRHDGLVLYPARILRLAVWAPFLTLLGLLKTLLELLTPSIRIKPSFHGRTVMFIRFPGRHSSVSPIRPCTLKHNRQDCSLHPWLHVAAAILLTAIMDSRLSRVDIHVDSLLRMRYPAPFSLAQVKGFACGCGCGCGSDFGEPHSKHWLLRLLGSL